MLEMIAAAINKEGSVILPCSTFDRVLAWEECIDEVGFWYNTPDHSTHLLKLEEAV